MQYTAEPLNISLSSAMWVLSAAADFFLEQIRPA